MADFLFEIGLEEVPARMIASAQKELAERTKKLLREQNLLEETATVQSYSTPRRLAVLVHGQADAVIAQVFALRVVELALQRDADVVKIRKAVTRLQRGNQCGGRHVVRASDPFRFFGGRRCVHDGLLALLIWGS